MANSLTRSERKARARRKRAVRRVLNALSTIIILSLCAYIGVMMWFGSTDPVISFFTGATPVPTARPTPMPTMAPVAVDPTPAPLPVEVEEEPVEIEETEVEPEITPEPTPEPTPIPVGLEEIDIGSINEKVLPSRPNLQLEETIYVDGEVATSYARTAPLSMNQPELYTDLDGVITFRGNHYRNNAAAGVLPSVPTQLTQKFSVDGSMGWVGQPLVICWSDEARLSMNLYADKKAKTGLVEVVCATLEGDILFFDLDDGTPTRDPIKTGVIIKGTPALDPRGYPILYCAQSGDGANSAMRIYSLIDGSELFSLSNEDAKATTGWTACDGSPLVDAETDSLFWASENGLVYAVTLNSSYDAAAGTVSVNPTVDRYRYVNPTTIFMGMESSMAVYNHYAFVTDNCGLIICLDMNTMEAVWVVSAGDDTDATIVLEEDDSGVWLYTGNVFSNTDKSRTIIRKLDALSGKSIWAMDTSITAKGTGGMFATPALGQNLVADLVYFTVAYATDDMGVLYAVDKNTGETVWKKNMGYYTWSSPLLTYDAEGNGYLLQCLGNGKVLLFDARTGDEITSLSVEGKIEASPVIYDDTMIIGTTTGKIYAVQLN